MIDQNISQDIIVHTSLHTKNIYFLKEKLYEDFNLSFLFFLNVVVFQ